MSDSRPQLEIRLIRPRQLAFLLLLVVAVLVALSLLGQISRFWFGHPHLQGFVPAFYLDYESNVPTWYSSFALLLAALLTALIAWAKFSGGDRYRWHWSCLAFLLACMSVDEIAMLHEYPIHPLRQFLDAGGLLHYTWVLPGALFVLLVGVAYLRFLGHLPARTRASFLLAAAIYLAGAIGVEMLSGLQADLYGEENMGYALITTAEELLEMLGIVVLITALLNYLPTAVSGIRIRSGGQPTCEHISPAGSPACTR